MAASSIRQQLAIAFLVASISFLIVVRSEQQLTISLERLKGLVCNDSKSAALEKLWDSHMRTEFEEGSKSVKETIDSMTDEPYVNHIPTLIGGMGRDVLRKFYTEHFIFSNPDINVIPVSRTVGQTSLVDEMVIEFNHTRRIDWLAPGVAPTGNKVRLPLVAIVGFDTQQQKKPKITHEHIYWDQASALLQLGVLRGENLDITGSEQASKVINPDSVPSNELLIRTGRWKK